MQPTFWQIGPRKTPIFLQARAARRTSAGAKVKAKAESDGAGALRLGVAGAMDPARLSFSLLGGLICPPQALARVHAGAPALRTCTLNLASWRVCYVVCGISVVAGGSMYVFGSLALAWRVPTGHSAGGANTGDCTPMLALRMEPRVACCQWNSLCGRWLCF